MTIVKPLVLLCSNDIVYLARMLSKESQKKCLANIVTFPKKLIAANNVSIVSEFLSIHSHHLFEFLLIRFNPTLIKMKYKSYSYFIKLNSAFIHYLQ